jgi:uncharacterized protein (DUF952 family)
MALHHVISADDWARACAAGRIAPASLAVEGFVHLSQSAQVAEVANRYFAGRTDLILLTLAPDALPEVRWEDLYGHGVFPHAYGPIALGAVTDARAWLPDADGAFRLTDPHA